MNYPKLSIVIPLRPGGSAAVVLDSLKNTDYPKDKIETFVIEGPNPSAQRNEAIRKSSGEFIFFFDDDSFISPELLVRAIDTYKAYPGASAVGGPAVLYGDTYFQQAVTIILTSFIGVYKIRARYKPVGKTRHTNEDELISCNLSIRRSVFDKQAAFHEALYPNEENELISRLLKNGFKFVYNPKCIVNRRTDDNMGVFLRRIFSYGRGRMEQLFVSKSKESFLRLLPLVFFACFLLLLALEALNHKFHLLLLVYLYAAVVLSGSIYNTRAKPKLLPLVAALYIATHFTYAFGQVYGLFKILKKDAEDNKRIN